MRTLSLCFLACISTASLPAQTPAHTLLPVPASVTMSGARLALDTTLSVGIVRYRDARLERAVGRALSRLEARTLLILPRTYTANRAARVVIDVAAQGFAVPDIDEDESYHLEVSAAQAVVTANTVVGAIRGLETLLQLQGADAKGYFLQGAAIQDAPRFRWRGLLVDAGRHFEPVEVIKRTIDGLAALKMNVFHWHLSEDQGFRVESLKYPKLQEQGSDGWYYTQNQIRDVVAFATDRGVRVVPEFDVPGHATSWLVGYPELASAPGPYQVIRNWGVFPGTMDPTREVTYQFLDAFIGEMAALFPDRYWHIGGDEVNAAQWKGNADIQKYMKANNLANEAALQTQFNRRLFTILKAHGKQPVGWDEIFQPDLPTEAVIQSWRNSEALAASAKQGHRGILSAPYYLDHIDLAREHYAADPLPANTDLTPAQQALILGGEACMWGEYVTSETIESRIFPRLGAVAERFWSAGSVTDVNDMYRRLEVTSRRLAELGLRHESHTEDMLRHIAIGADADALRTFLEYARPRGFGGRGTNQQSPLTHLIDAARPDPWNGWRMQDRAARALTGDTAAVRALHENFVQMSQLPGALAAIRDRVPAADEGTSVANALLQLSRVGDQALGYITRKESPSASWRANADSVVRVTVGRTFGLLRPVGAEAVRTLVGAVPK